MLFLRLPLFFPIASLSTSTFSLTPCLAQHFIQSDVMEDGQVAGRYATDREADDPTDVEYNGEAPPSDSTDDEASSDGFSDFPDEYDDDDDAAAADTRTTARGGTPDSSLERFLAEWDDEGSGSNIGDSDAAPRARPPKVPSKRPRASGSTTAVPKTSKAAPVASRGQSSRDTTTRRPTGPAPLGRTGGGSISNEAPLDIVPLRVRLPTSAPKSAG